MAGYTPLMIELRTARLRLRGFTAEDRDAIVALDANPEVRRYLDAPDPTPPERAEWWLNSLRTTYPDGSRRGYWAAEFEGELVGWFHLRPSRDTAECELGYRFRQEVWGRGLATEGSTVLLELAFADNEPRVIARTLVENTGSRRVMEKLGMTETRRFLHDYRLPAIEYARPHPERDII